MKKISFKTPSRNHLIMFTIVWFVSMLLIVLVTTDLFTESFFQYKNLEIQFLMFLATLATAMSYVDYFKNRGIDLINKKTDSKLSSLIFIFRICALVRCYFSWCYNW